MAESRWWHPRGRPRVLPINTWLDRELERVTRELAELTAWNNRLKVALELMTPARRTAQCDIEFP